jgi:hypothetical protein
VPTAELLAAGAKLEEGLYSTVKYNFNASVPAQKAGFINMLKTVRRGTQSSLIVCMFLLWWGCLGQGRKGTSIVVAQPQLQTYLRGTWPSPSNCCAGSTLATACVHAVVAGHF